MILIQKFIGKIVDSLFQKIYSKIFEHNIESIDTFVLNVFAVLGYENNTAAVLYISFQSIAVIPACRGIVKISEASVKRNHYCMICGKFFVNILFGNTTEDKMRLFFSISDKSLCFQILICTEFLPGFAVTHFF